MSVFLFFVGGKASYCSVFISAEKSSDLDPVKLHPTNVYVWKSARTVLSSKNHFSSKDANQNG